MRFPLRNTCARMQTTADDSIYRLAVRNQMTPDTEELGMVRAISAEIGATV